MEQNTTDTVVVFRGWDEGWGMRDETGDKDELGKQDVWDKDRTTEPELLKQA